MLVAQEQLQDNGRVQMLGVFPALGVSVLEKMYHRSVAFVTCMRSHRLLPT